MASQKDLLEKWSSRIKAEKLDETIAVVKNALAGYKRFPKSVRVAYYLHGSHLNGTNTQYNTPVDVAIELTSITGSSKSNEDPFAGKDLTYKSFRENILESMQNAFGEGSVQDGDNVIHIIGSPNRLPVNVLVCFKYKLFIKHGRDEVEKLGVAFYTKKGKELIINFPKQHNAYEAVKESGSQGQFLATVRVFKNIRDRLVQMGHMDENRTPSYFLESFICNAPTGMFTKDYISSIANLLDFWKKNAWRNYITIDGFRSLWGDPPQSWNVEDAKFFLEAIRKVGKDPAFWQSGTDA
ncbi:MAG: hypothetical protein RIB86_10015 [Imperialibacter sp.]